MARSQGRARLNDAGTLGINSTQTIAGPLVVSGVVTGNSPLTVSGSLTTSGANFEGPGSVTVATGATWGASASSSTTVSGGTLINAGSATLNTSASLSIGTGITVTNTGSFTMRGSSSIYGSNSPNAIFNNTGTLVVNPGSAGTATLYGYGYLTVNNTGSLQLTSGTLDVSSATLNLNGGSVTGSGTLDNQGTLGINSTQSIAALDESGGSVQMAASKTRP